VQRYVRRVGMELKGIAERPNLPWNFYVLDDAAVNAFAYPGGFIFVTRGILTHMNSEAELAPNRFELVPGGYFEAEVDAALKEARDILSRRR